jgi:hypothetical protein
VPLTALPLFSRTVSRVATVRIKSRVVSEFLRKGQLPKLGVDHRMVGWVVNIEL